MKKSILVCTIILNLALIACSKQVNIAESPFTIQNWKIAMENRTAQRYELAYHYYSIALSSAANKDSFNRIQLEMEEVERIMQTQR